MPNPRAAATVYVSLAFAALCGPACRAQGVPPDTSSAHSSPDSSATQGAIMDSISVVNSAGLTVDRACLDQKFTLLKRLIDAGRLDPVRTEIYAESPIIIELLKSAHVKASYQDKTVLSGLAEGSYIVTIDAANRYALFHARKEDNFSWADCLTGKPGH